MSLRSDPRQLDVYIRRHQCFTVLDTGNHWVIIGTFPGHLPFLLAQLTTYVKYLTTYVVSADLAKRQPLA